MVTKEHKINAQFSLDLDIEPEVDGRYLDKVEKAFTLIWRPSRRWLSGIVDNPLEWYQVLVGPWGLVVILLGRPWTLPRCNDGNGRPDNDIQ